MKFLLSLLTISNARSVPWPTDLPPVLPPIFPLSPVPVPCYVKQLEDLKVLENNPMIMDFFPVLCQTGNVNLYVAKQYSWTGRCFCKDTKTGEIIDFDADCTKKCPKRPDLAAKGPKEILAPAWEKFNP